MFARILSIKPFHRPLSYASNPELLNLPYNRDNILSSRLIHDTKTSYGLSTSIDLSRCNPDKIKCRNSIKHHIEDICFMANMKPFGPMKIDYFSDNIKDKRIARYAITQLCNGGSITGHFFNHSNNANIDIFSYKTFDATSAAQYSAYLFDASDYNYDVKFRK